MFISLYLELVTEYKDSINIMNYIINTLDYYKYGLLKKFKFFIISREISIAYFNNT